MKHITCNKAKNKGFTLTELIVVTAIFALIIITAIGLMMAAIQTQRKGIALQSIQDNGRHLMAFMAKEIRVSEIVSGDAPPGPDDTLVIDPPNTGDPETDGTEVTYTFTGPQITRKAYIYTEVGKKYEWVTAPLNSDEVNVIGKFIIDGKTAEDNEQPRVTIIMKVESKGTGDKEKAEIDLQTTVSQRNLD